MGTGRSQASTGRSQRDKYADFAARMDQALTLPLAPNPDPNASPNPYPNPNPEPEPNPDPDPNPNPSHGPGGGQLAAFEAQQPWAIRPGNRAGRWGWAMPRAGRPRLSDAAPAAWRRV